MYMLRWITPCKKLERQIVKHRTRWERHLRDGALKEMEPQFLTADESLAAQEEAQPTIVRTKSIPMKPMMKEEAALQMDMLGHSFFVFEDGADRRDQCDLQAQRWQLWAD